MRTADASRCPAMRGPGGLIALAAACLAVAAAPARAADPIPWRSHIARNQAPASMTPAEAAAAIEMLVASPDVRHLVVQCAGPLTRTDRRVLDEAGLEIQAALGSHAFTVRVDPERLDGARLRRVTTLRLAMPLTPEMKLHRDFLSGNPDDLPPWAHARVAREIGADPVDVAAAYVLLHRDVDPDIAMAVVEAFGGRIVSRIRLLNGLVIEMPTSQFFALAGRDEVLWIEPPLPPLEGVNDSNRVAVQAEAVQDPPYGLDGSGVCVLVYDVGEALASHADFGGRLVVHDYSGIANHSTHVAGTIGGDGATSESGLYRGMAPGVWLHSYGFEQVGGLVPGFLYTDPGDLEDDYHDAIVNFSAVLANNSIGTNTASNGFPCEWEGDYGVTSALIDAIVRGDMGSPTTVVWANGNERSAPGACGTTYHTTAPPACAKNHLTVGALNSNDNTVADFSSWGPADDGRLKPDLAAPGCQSNGDGGVTSCASNGSYSTLCGTSMAAPTATGCAALLIQDHRIQFPNRPDPLPSTVKALLIHAAMDLGNPGPDYQSGYGLIQVRDTIDFLRTANFTEGAVDQGDELMFVLDVPAAAGAQPLKVTLAWDDAPGAPLVDPALVNDMDLLVTGPGGTAFPWTLDPQQPGLAAVRNAPDQVNNIEQVLIDAAAPGRYTIHVIGTNVPVGPQRFSLAAGPMLVNTSVRLSGGVPAIVSPGEPTVVAASVVAANETIVPGSVTLHFRFDGGSFESVAMAGVGGDLYEGVIPPTDCDAQPQFYFSAQGSESGLAVDPPGAPAAAYGYELGTMSDLFADDFESNLGWTVTNSPGLDDGAWERGVPLGDGSRGDPTTDADGSGQCYLTNNGAGNTDVDGGSTTLVSPVLLGGSGTPIISYARWYSNDEGSAPNEDIFEVDISDDGGATWSSLELVGPAGPGTTGGWVHVDRDLSQVSGFDITGAIRIRFTASDFGSGSVVEAGVDSVRLVSIDCIDAAIPCLGDVSKPSDGQVDVVDLLAMLAAWDTDDPDLDIAPAGGDGVVNILDLLLLLSTWGPCP